MSRRRRNNPWPIHSRFWSFIAGAALGGGLGTIAGAVLAPASQTPDPGTGLPVPNSAALTISSLGWLAGGLYGMSLAKG